MVNLNVYFLQEKRFSTLLHQKKQISDLMLEMDRSPETNFEKDVICEDDTDFILSQDNMHSLDALLAEVWLAWWIELSLYDAVCKLKSVNWTLELFDGIF